MTESAKGPASSVFFLAELPYHELLRKRDLQKAMKLEARMQQILGEAVYLFDGRVIDSVGPRLIAIMPTARHAVDAALKGRLDLKDHNRRQPPSGDVVEAALVVHGGPPVSDGSAFTSPTVTTGLQLLRSMQPGQLLISEKVLQEAGTAVPSSLVGEAAGARFYEPAAEQPKSEEPAAKSEQAHIEPAPAARSSLLAPRSSIRSKPGVLLGIVAGIVVLVGVVAGILVLNREERQQAPVPTTQPERVAPKPIPVKQRVVLQPVSGAPDRRSAERVGRIEQLIEELIRRNSRIEVSDASDATPLTITVMAGKPLTLVPGVGAQSGSPVSLDPPGAAAANLLGFFADALVIPRHELTSSDTALMGRLLDAVSTYHQTARPSRQRALTLLHHVIQADPTFLAALRLGVDWFGESGDRSRAVQTAETLLIHEPGDLAVRRKAAFWQIEEGKPVQALTHLAALIEADSTDRDALVAIGRIALSAGDEAKFRRVVSRLEQLDGIPTLHEPDLLSAKGQIDAAVKGYYALERKDPNNAALALKIGRIAVLRHSLPIAELELTKLRRLDPAYGYPLLQAYLAAEHGFGGDAMKSLQQAQQSAGLEQDPYTSSAEVFAILNDSRVLESLKSAEARGEATATYILSNPLFRYLKNDAEFVALLARLEEQRIVMRQRLAKLSL